MKRFDSFQVTPETYIKKIGLISEDVTMPDLFGDDSAEVVVSIRPNDFSTYQVFNRLTGSRFIPPFVMGRLHAQKMPSPITTISPVSEIKTFSTKRALNSASLPKNSIYFARPKINDQFQITANEGKIIGIRQIIEGKSVHITANRFPTIHMLQPIMEELYDKLKSDLIRVRIGSTDKGMKLLAMENFKLDRPELAELYFTVYENYIGHMPEWFKHHIESTMVNPFLNEKIDKSRLKSLYPYIR